MKIFSELIILHPNTPFPEPETFMTDWINGHEYEMNGDYYVEGLRDKWTTLEIKCKEPNHQGIFKLLCHRENHPYPYPLVEQEDLFNYIQHFRNGSYGEMPHIPKDEPLAATILSISTPHLAIYHQFLQSVHEFLRTTQGCVLNYQLLDHAEFYQEFLA